jgi:pimeloyl-ACP methyl ester carboxylesterase
MMETLDPRIEGAIELRDGRSIGFAEYGAPGGAPIFWFPGTPGGRRQIPPRIRTATVECDVRMIALERPGLGASTPHLYESVLGWAADVEEIADGLGLNRFGLVGLSGGGAYVLACAYALAERVVAGAVLGGVAPALGDDAPPGGAMGFAARTRFLLHPLREPLGHAIWATVYALRPLASQVFDLFVSMMPEGDQQVMQRPEMKEMFLDDMLRASRPQLHALLYDSVLFTRHWGFSPREIRVPIRFWHGDADNMVPLEHAEHLAAIVPDAELRVRPREGHMGNLDAAEEVLDTLLALWL